MFETFCLLIIIAGLLFNFDTRSIRERRRIAAPQPPPPAPIAFSDILLNVIDEPIIAGWPDTTTSPAIPERGGLVIDSGYKAAGLLVLANVAILIAMGLIVAFCLGAYVLWTLLPRARDLWTALLEGSDHVWTLLHEGSDAPVASSDAPPAPEQPSAESVPAGPAYRFTKARNAARKATRQKKKERKDALQEAES